jgi:outer membrane protein assembly factor BamB
MISATLLLVALLAADWPRFRGPNGSGVADASEAPAELAQSVVWKVPLPPGHSSPILSDTRIFLTALDDGKLYTYSIDRDSGKVVWRREGPRSRNEPVDKRNSAASPSPVIDGSNVYVFFGDYGLISYSHDGRERWRTPLGPFQNAYGMGASPILAGDKVVLVCDQGVGSFVIAVDRDSGRVRWKTPRPEAVSGHSTPVLYEPENGSPQILAPGSFQLTSYSAETGEKLWWITGLPSEMKSVPVIAGDTVYISGYNTPENDPGKQVKIPSFDEALAQEDANKDGRLARAEVTDRKLKSYFPYLDLNRDGFLNRDEWRIYQASMAAENGLLALRLGGRGDVTRTSLRWKYQKSIPQLPSPLLYRNVLYMINDGGVLSTFNPETGALLQQSRMRGAIDHYYASPVAAGGKVFLVSQSGVVTVLKAGGTPEVLTFHELDDEAYATPAIGDGRIYVRTRSALYCFGK